MIIALSGKARIGKDTAAQFFNTKFGTVSKNFAAKVKEIALNINSFIHVSNNVLVSNKTDEVVTALNQYTDLSSIKVSKIRDKDVISYPFWDGREDNKREPLVEIGHKFRSFLGEDVWINALFNSKDFDKDVLTNGITVSDVRYINEHKALKAKARKLKVPYKLIYIDNPLVDYPNDEERSTLPPVEKAASNIVYNIGSIDDYLKLLDSIQF